MVYVHLPRHLPENLRVFEACACTSGEYRPSESVVSSFPHRTVHLGDDHRDSNETRNHPAMGTMWIHVVPTKTERQPISGKSWAMRVLELRVDLPIGQVAKLSLSEYEDALSRRYHRTSILILIHHIHLYFLPCEPAQIHTRKKMIVRDDSQIIPEDEIGFLQRLCQQSRMDQEAPQFWTFYIIVIYIYIDK